MGSARVPTGFPDPVNTPRAIEINGGNGNDQITGASQPDRASQERFIFEANWGRDTIAGGFDPGADRLVFGSGGPAGFGSFDGVSGTADWTLLEYHGQSVLTKGLSVLDVQGDPSAVIDFW